MCRQTRFRCFRCCASQIPCTPYPQFSPNLYFGVVVQLHGPRIESKSSVWLYIVVRSDPDHPCKRFHQIYSSRHPVKDKNYTILVQELRANIFIPIEPKFYNQFSSSRVCLDSKSIGQLFPNRWVWSGWGVKPPLKISKGGPLQSWKINLSIDSGSLWGCKKWYGLLKLDDPK